MNDYQFGNFLFSLRTEKNISQSELGMLIGVSKSSVSKWENGKAIPPMSTLRRLSAVFNVSVEELLSGERRNISDKIPSTLQVAGCYEKKEITLRSKNLPAYILMIFLFVLDFFSLYIGLALAAGSGDNYFNNLWCFYIAALIPAVSLILGIIFKVKGYKTKKNIIAGAIFLVLCIIYGSMSFSTAYDYSYVEELEARVGTEFPDNGEIFMTFISENAEVSGGGYLISSTANIYFTDIDEVMDFDRSLLYNEFWITDPDPEILKTMVPNECIPGYIEQDGWLYMLYNESTGEYNSLPEGEGEYRCIFIMYDRRGRAMTVYEYEIELENVIGK